MARRLSGLLVSVLAVGGCGSSTGLPEYQAAGYPAVKTVVLEASFELAPLGTTRFGFRVPEQTPTRTVDVFAIVDWTHPDNNVVAALTGGSCEDANLALAGACEAGIYHARPSLCSAKPRVVVATGATGALLKLFLANTGASAESGRVQVYTCQDDPDCAEGFACDRCLAEKLETESCR